MIGYAKIWDPSKLLQETLLKVKNKQVTKLVLLCQYEFKWHRFIYNIDFMNEVIIEATKNDIPVYIVVNTATQSEFSNYSNVTMVEWPTFFLNRAYATIDPPTTNYGNPSKLYCLLNGKKRYHRCLTMDMLAKFDMINLGHISWFDSDKIMFADREKFKFEYWQETNLKLDHADEKNWHAVIPSQLYESWIHLVSETTVITDIFFLTEKTAKSLFLAKPFLVISSRGYHKFLQSLGFKLYDEMFDYSFDDHDHLETRISKIIQDNLAPLSSKNESELLQITKTIQSKLEYNKNLAIEYATNTKYIPGIVNQLIDAEYVDDHDVRSYYKLNKK